MDGVSVYAAWAAQHAPQLLLSGVPDHLWPALSKKLRNQTFDAGRALQLLDIDYEGEDEDGDPRPARAVRCSRALRRADPESVFLVDHALTFTPAGCRERLRRAPGLLRRMCDMMRLRVAAHEDPVEAVSRELWRYAQTYAVGGGDLSAEEQVPIWYVTDELGCGIHHSDEPNFRMVPFVHIPERTTYSLLFPIVDVDEGDIVTRNFIEGGFDDELQREAMLIPWRRYRHFHKSHEQVEPEASYFLGGHVAESLPDGQSAIRRTGGQLKVFSEYSFINQNLTSEDFEIVDNEDEADILWFMNHFKKYKELNEISPHKFINQFPYEHVITIKDLLAIIARRCKETPSNDTLETYPTWLPTTFNMKTELPKLVAYFQRRKQAGLDNTWICKPFNLARGLDTYITDDLNFLCRLPLTGPKIAQKYIEDPVLFDRPDCGLVKFDVRYVILLKSVNPTKVFIYKNFFLRFSNKPFALSNFDDYEQHFTVMNYNENATLFRMLCAEFRDNWSKQYPDISWSKVEENIFEMFAKLFTAATAKDPPCGIGKNTQSRALYAADIMLAWKTVDNVKTVVPQLLEVNWMPDCKRACEYYPDFYNDIFSVLFLDKDVETCQNIL